MYCPYCGTKNSKNANYCRKCGKPLNKSENMNKNNTGNNFIKSNDINRIHKTDDIKSESFSKWWHGLSTNAQWIISIVAIILVVILVGGIFSSVGGSSSGSNSNSSVVSQSEIDRISHKMNKENELSTVILHVIPKSNYIEVTVDDSASDGDLENAWDDTYDSNGDHIPVHFIDSETTFEIAKGYSDSDSISFTGD